MNMSSSFKEMRDDIDLVDVTLACGVKMQLQAHKFVLSASSPFFKEILRNNKHPHPLIYLKGIKAGALESVIDFIYRGEVNIYQEDLNDFLAAAEELELKGLTGQQPMEEDKPKNTHIKEETPQLKIKHNTRDKVLLKTDPELSNADVYPVQNLGEFQEAINSSTDMLSVGLGNNTNNDELNETVKSLLERVGDAWNCKMCGQKSGFKVSIKRHIESKHTTGGSFPCKLCGKIFRSSNSISTHLSKSHPK